MINNTKKIYLGAGCFWGVEAYFQHIQGITDTGVGYAGGDIPNPTYELVCTGTTGHAEVVELEFDPNLITLQDILQHFERIHDPTSLNRQGNDRGTQYRSAIYTSSLEDRQTAERWKNEASLRYSKPITTEITLLKTFYPAEEYHQDYLKKNPSGYCHIDISLAKKELVKYPK